MSLPYLKPSRCGGGRLKEEEIYVWLRQIHTVVQKKPTQHCKAIIFQLKIHLKKPSRSTPWPETCIPGPHHLSDLIPFALCPALLANSVFLKQTLPQHGSLTSFRSLLPGEAFPATG